MDGTRFDYLKKLKTENSHAAAVKFLILLEEKIMPTDKLRSAVGQAISDIEYKTFMRGAGDYVLSAFK